MPRIEFEADTEEDLLKLAWRWVMGPQQRAGSSSEDRADQADLRRRQLGEALNAVRGADSRRLLREVAELALLDGALVLAADLAARYGPGVARRSQYGPRSTKSQPARGTYAAVDLSVGCMRLPWARAVGETPSK